MRTNVIGYFHCIPFILAVTGVPFLTSRDNNNNSSKFRVRKIFPVFGVSSIQGRDASWYPIRLDISFAATSRINRVVCNDWLNEMSRFLFHQSEQKAKTNCDSDSLYGFPALCVGYTRFLVTIGSFDYLHLR